MYLLLYNLTYYFTYNTVNFKHGHFLTQKWLFTDIDNHKACSSD
jgi:hypothetical protein